jgi:hypothetical protein
MKIVHDEPGLVIGPDRRLDGLCLRFFGCRVRGDALIRPKKLGLLTEVALSLTHFVPEGTGRSLKCHKFQTVRRPFPARALFFDKLRGGEPFIFGRHLGNNPRRHVVVGLTVEQAAGL